MEGEVRMHACLNGSCLQILCYTAGEPCVECPKGAHCPFDTSVPNGDDDLLNSPLPDTGVWALANPDTERTLWGYPFTGQIDGAARPQSWIMKDGGKLPTLFFPCDGCCTGERQNRSFGASEKSCVTSGNRCIYTKDR